MFSVLLWNQDDSYPNPWLSREKPLYTSTFPHHFSLVCVIPMLSRSASLLRSSNLTRAFASTLKDYPINGFFDAKSYAIIGASEKKETLGYIISDNFYHKFQGKTFFVNPKGFKLVGVLTTRRRAVWTAYLQEGF